MAGGESDTGDIEMGATTTNRVFNRDRDHHSSEGVKDQVWEQEKKNHVEVGKRLKHMGYRTKHPVALFNSLSGCVIEVVESKSMPSWSTDKKTGGSSKNENALWVDINKVTGSVLGRVRTICTGCLFSFIIIILFSFFFGVRAFCWPSS